MAGEKSEDIQVKFRKLQLESETTVHLYFKKYREALAILRTLQQLITNTDIVEKVYFKVIESECHLRLEEDSAASMVIQDIDKLLTLYDVMPDDVIKMAETFKDERRYCRAYILYYAACKLYISNPTKDTSSKVRSVFDEMTNITKEMVEFADDKNIVARHVVPAMKKLIEELMEMPDNGVYEQIEQRAWCYSNVGKCYHYLEDSHQFLEMNETAVDLMKAKLGGDAEKYRVTGHCYNNAGYAYSSLGRKDRAVIRFISAISIYEKATTYTDANTRVEDIARARKNLDDMQK